MNYNINMFMCLYSRHWILAMICPKILQIFRLDPLDIHESKYKEFIIVFNGNNISTYHKSYYHYSY
jgi:hypothetical protein